MPINESMLTGTPVREQYQQRALHDLNLQVQVVDFGPYAGTSTSACFWLCLAAGLSTSSWQVPPQALPGLEPATSLLREMQEKIPLVNLDGAPASQIQNSPLGRLAFLLRQYMCEGNEAVLLRSDVRARIFPAFALIGSNRQQRTMQSYKRWVQRLASREYADELVILATASELRINIVCVLYTPTNALN